MTVAQGEGGGSNKAAWSERGHTGGDALVMFSVFLLTLPPSRRQGE